MRPDEFTSPEDVKTGYNDLTLGRLKQVRDGHIKELKSEITEFLWTRLPGNCTIQEAEELAFEFNNKILNLWDKKIKEYDAHIKYK